METLKLSGRMIEIPTNKNLDSKVDLPDYANDSKATEYLTKNTNSHSKTLQSAILSSTKPLQSHNIHCSVSGIALTISLPSDLKDFSSPISLSLPVSSLVSLAMKSTREELYSLSPNVLAGLALTVLSSKSLLITKDSNTFLTNSILSTSGKTNLVESIMLYSLIIKNGIDPDTLPKLDTTLSTHYEGIANFEQPLSEYLASLKENIDEQTMSEATKRERIRREREELAILQKNKQEERKNKTLVSTYETKRKLASSALKDATIDLYFLNYKKLVEAISILTSKGGKATREETKQKILLRLNEILTNQDSPENEELLANIRIIKDFVTLSLSDRLINQVDSSLERARDIKTTNELNSVSKTLTLKEKLALKLANSKKAGN